MPLVQKLGNTGAAPAAARNWDFAYTWTGGSAWSSDYQNITDTSSTVDSRVFERAVGGTVVASINKLGVAKFGNGTVSLPAYSFDSDPDSGMYRIGANNIGFSVNGSLYFSISASGAVFGATADFSGNLSLNYTHQIFARTGDVTISNFTASQSVNTNTGAAGEVIVTLPGAVVGRAYKFCVTAAQYIRAKAAGTDTIRFGTTVSAAAGYIRSNVIGTYFMLECTKAGEWYVAYTVGTAPTVDS